MVRSFTLLRIFTPFHLGGTPGHQNPAIRNPSDFLEAEFPLARR
jgi:hypothetical protein